jgi:hypothetical protein
MTRLSWYPDRQTTATLISATVADPTIIIVLYATRSYTLLFLAATMSTIALLIVSRHYKVDVHQAPETIRWLSRDTPATSDILLISIMGIWATTYVAIATLHAGGRASINAVMTSATCWCLTLMSAFKGLEFW